MQKKYSKSEFDIIPESYVLPEDYVEFQAVFKDYQSIDRLNNHWIVKPAASSRGRGIFITSTLKDFSMDQK